jgi:hypothetical protein
MTILNFFIFLAITLLACSCKTDRKSNDTNDSTINKKVNSDKDIYNVNKIDYTSVTDYEIDSGIFSDSNNVKFVILRKFKANTFNRKNLEYCLVLNPFTLETSVLPYPKYKITVEKAKLEDSPYYKWIEKSRSFNQCCHNAGIRNTENNEGMVISIDLCPSQKVLEYKMIDFFVDSLKKSDVSFPLSICISGKWIQYHKKELDYIKSLEDSARLNICWINHSLNHNYSKGVELKANFMLSAGTNYKSEIIDNELIMIRNGLIPSCFLRFPGLVSDESLYSYVISLGLLPIGSDAWLANKVKPKEGSIILLHGNGNEPYGFEILKVFYRNGKLNEPVHDLRKQLCKLK